MVNRAQIVLTKQASSHLLKSIDASIHAENVTMYLVGAFLNISLYLIRKISDPIGEPGFFTGFNSLSAVGLVILNASIGLVVTAVYKCKSSPS